MIEGSPYQFSMIRVLGSRIEVMSNLLGSPPAETIKRWPGLKLIDLSAQCVSQTPPQRSALTVLRQSTTTLRDQEPLTKALVSRPQHSTHTSSPGGSVCRLDRKAASAEDTAKSSPMVANTRMTLLMASPSRLCIHAHYTTLFNRRCL